MSIIKLLVFIILLFLTISCSSDEEEFVSEDTVVDIDGNIYKTIKIGNQIWATENLKTTRYNDGTAIPLVSDKTEWRELKTPGYCWYNNDEESFKSTYGALYNFHAVMTGKLAPVGWHVASDEEWKELELYLGMGEEEVDEMGYRRGGNVGGKLKDTGFTYWDEPNIGATNETGFTALPGGCRNYVGNYEYVNEMACFISTTAISNTNPYVRVIGVVSSGISRGGSDGSGLSVRIIKDLPTD